MGGAEMEGRFEGASCSARSCSVELPRPTLFMGDPNGLYFSCSIDSILLSLSPSRIIADRSAETKDSTKSGLYYLWPHLSACIKFLICRLSFLIQTSHPARLLAKPSDPTGLVFS